MASTTASKPSSISSNGSSSEHNKSNHQDAGKNGGGENPGAPRTTTASANLTVPSPAAADAARGGMAGSNGGRLDSARSSPQKPQPPQKSSTTNTTTTTTTFSSSSPSQNNHHHHHHHASVMSLPPNQQPPTTRLSAPGSSATSTLSSRETSPIRRPHFQSMNSTSHSRAASRSRRSSQEFSPSRRSSSSGPNYTSVPSPAAVQNALKNKPNLDPSAIDPPAADSSKPDKQNMSRRGDTSPRSPRLKSPPSPLATSRNDSLPSMTSPQRAEQEPSPRPNISCKRSNGSSGDSSRHSPSRDYDIDDAPAPPGMRTPIRGASNGGSTLETVQEGSLPSTPATEKSNKTVTNLDEAKLEKVDEDEPAPSIKSTTESGSDSGGNKSAGVKGEDKANKKIKPGDIISKQSFTSLNTGRGKPGDSSVRSMIVETETVSSVPQVSLGGGASERASGRTEAGGSVRMKPSNETIRPKKEKKKPARKTTNLATGTVSSKADIFEAKVANAVDEANSSDSDETFVYESNPADPHQPSRSNRHHSRTPSATSMASQMDQFGGRSRNTGHNLVGKRSMRFTSRFYNNGYEGEGDEGNGRGGRTNGNGTASRHNLGRYNRDTDYASNLFDDSLHMSKSPRHLIGNGNRHSRSGSPRNHGNYRTMGSPKKNGDAYGFDFDAEGADDERTPLVGSIRINRNRNGRRQNNSLRQMEYVGERKRWRLPRYANCVFLMLLLVVIVGGVTSFIVALTKPLMGVYIDEIQNVLASEQEIMLDLDVRATNPNLFALTVGDMDVNIFAKSRYVGSEKFWRDGPHPDGFPRVERAKRWASISERRNEQECSEDDTSSNELVHTRDKVDKGTDPIPEDPSGDPQTMLLGRIFEFDSPLTFDPSPWTSNEESSVGQVRLSKPGNKTEEGGTERWERVLQHPFDLIVRGVVKYQLPLSSKFRSASISSSVRVIPDDDDDTGTGEGDDGENDDGDEDSGRNDTFRIKPIRKRAVTQKFKLLPISTESQPPPPRCTGRAFVA